MVRLSPAPTPVATRNRAGARAAEGAHAPPASRPGNDKSRKVTPCGSCLELPGQDSNLDKESQNLLCYRYTTGYRKSFFYPMERFLTSRVVGQTFLSAGKTRQTRMSALLCQRLHRLGFRRKDGEQRRQ